MYDKNDPIGKSTEMTAKLFALMADEMIRECGEEKGGEMARRAVRRFGVMRAEAAKQRILADGKEITFETVEEYSDYPANHAWDCDTQIEGDVLREVTRVCPFSTAFREIGMEYPGCLYCEEIDRALNETFFGEIEFERPQLFSDGPDAPCEMIVRRVKKEREKGGET